MKEKEEERRKFREDTQKAVKEVLKAKPLHLQYEEKYREEFEIPELQRKKKQLEEVRKMHKPIE